MTPRKLGIILPVLSLVAGLLLAVAPQSYRSPGGFQGKAGVVESEVVDCGITLAPKNPPPPPGANDECDAQHVRRVVAITAVVLAGFILGGMALFTDRVVRRRQLVSH